MKLQSLHSHSLFDDGKSTMEEMVQGALAQGLSALGFSGHSPMPTPQGWTVQAEDLPRYRQEALRLKAAYRDQIPLYYGLELTLSRRFPSMAMNMSSALSTIFPWTAAGSAWMTP